MPGSFSILLVCGAFALIVWLLFFRREAGEPRGQASDNPEQVYSVFTTEFDVDAIGADAASALEELPPSKRFFSRMMQDTSWNSRIVTANATCLAADISVLQRWVSKDSGARAIVLLVDLSGSMANTIVTLAGELRRCCEFLSAYGVPTALLGFTSAGWKGGQARQKWLSLGSPARPGRLCDLLHVCFKKFDSQLLESDWQAMLHPALLCENVDGEALRWAADLLKARAEPNKFLIVISDGAPVDDSTLMANGPGFLERHLKSTIAELESERQLSFGAIGVGFAVDRYYENSVQMDGSVTLSESLGTLLANLESGKGSVLRNT